MSDATPGGPAEQPFSLLLDLFGDPEMAAVFSEKATVQRWLDVERELADVQASLGLIPQDQAERVQAAATVDGIDLPRLWREARIVGYPILPLVRALTARMGDGATFAHYGATTQDIMDTGLVLQLRDAFDLFFASLDEVASRLASLVEQHSTTVMAARTHSQQAVPTTLGAKLAVFLDEFTRDYERGLQVRERVEVVSLFGAGGTNAALGPESHIVRDGLAKKLGLRVADVPWHVARDRLVEFGQYCVLLCGACGRLAHEVIALSRTEIDELQESWSHHRGASSTMPQKANPILCEAVVGLTETVNGLGAALPHAMRAGHERAAGEWQLEWEVLPRMAVLTAGCLRTTAELLAGLRVNTDAMKANLAVDGGRIMAEAYMFAMAPELGREAAHDIVYDAAVRSRQSGRPLFDILCEDERVAGISTPLEAVTPEAYVGEAERVCAAALAAWEALPKHRES